MKSILEALEWRYAVKKFDAGKKIDPQNWETLERALVLTPSSYGLQPWKFFIPQSVDLRTALRAASWNQSQITDCSHLVVLAAKTNIDSDYVTNYVELVSKTRSVPIEKLEGLKKVILGDLESGPRSKYVQEWAARQCYIALGNLMTTAASIGIDACPIEGFDPAKYDEILNIKNSGYKSVVVCAIGHRASDDPLAQAKKVRFAHDKIIKFL